MKPAGISQEEIAALFAQERQDAEPKPAAFPALEPAAQPAVQHSLGLLAGVELEVTVQLGETHMKIREILSCGPGSVVELDRLAGEAVDILVNGYLVARGEVVVVAENFGVRVTELVRNHGDLPR